MAKWATNMSFSWCSECKVIHVGLYDDEEMIAVGNIGDLDTLIGMLVDAKGKKEEWVLSGEAQRMQ